MVLNNFGESDDNSNNHVFSRGLQGDPGLGFNLTVDGDFDISNKKLCNVGDPIAKNDACTKDYADTKISVLDHLINGMGGIRDKVEQQNVDIKTIPAQNGRIQQVHNTLLSETRKINASITTKFNENNERLKKFSDNTEMIINSKYDAIDKKLEDYSKQKDDIDVYKKQINDITSRTADDIMSLNIKIKNLEGVYSAVDKKINKIMRHLSITF